MLIDEIVRINALCFSNKYAIVDFIENKRLTWDRLNGRVNRFANALNKIGLHKGNPLQVT